MACVELSKVVKKEQGFSLFEIAIAVAIMGALLYGLASIIRVDIDYEDYRDNKALVQTAKGALMAYVQSNNFLPCPDTDGDGVENRNANRTCVAAQGALPHIDLGVAERDPWNNPLLYAVTPNATTLANLIDANDAASYFNNDVVTTGEPFFNINTPPFSNTAYAGALFICGENAAVCGGATPAADLIEIAGLAVIVSFGKNGTQSWGNITATNNTAISEVENLDSDNYFLRAMGSNNVNGFDDELAWITGFDVKFALVRSDDSLGD